METAELLENVLLFSYCHGLNAIKQAKTLEELERVRLVLLGRKGIIPTLEKALWAQP